MNTGGTKCTACPFVRPKETKSRAGATPAENESDKTNADNHRIADKKEGPEARNANASLVQQTAAAPPYRCAACNMQDAVPCRTLLCMESKAAIRGVLPPKGFKIMHQDELFIAGIRKCLERILIAPRHQATRD